MAAAALYFELGSPYSYLAVERAGAVLGAEPDLRPILLGAIFKLRGYGSWGHTAERDSNVAEVDRRAREYGLPPVAWQPGWPPNTLAAMRACVWAGERGVGREFAVAAFRRAFVDGSDLADIAVLRDVAASVGLPGAQLEGAVADPAVKAALRETTEGAWERGVAGAPTLELDGRLFYGDDQLEAAREQFGVL